MSMSHVACRIIIIIVKPIHLQVVVVNYVVQNASLFTALLFPCKVVDCVSEIKTEGVVCGWIKQKVSSSVLVLRACFANLKKRLCED